jgi:hypothetical protein
MNEFRLRRLCNRIVSFSAPLPLVVYGVACGGSSLTDRANSNPPGAAELAGAEQGGAEHGGAEHGELAAKKALAAVGSAGAKGGVRGSAGTALAGVGGQSAGAGGADPCRGAKSPISCAT